MESFRSRLAAAAAAASIAVAGLAPAGAAELARLKPGEGFLTSPEHLKLFVLSNQLVVEEDVRGKQVKTCYCGPQITLSEIPLHVRQALIAIEDRRFLQHNGVDPYAIGRAVVRRMAGDRQGGSTITQQLCKKKVLSSEETILRKRLDATCAFSLETVMSKDAILEAYLNGMEFGYAKGRPVVGIEQAARHHFGKRARDLSVREGAMLVGMQKSPARYNPTSKPEDAKARAATVLKAMHEMGYITAVQLKKHLASPIIKGKLAMVDFEPRYFTDWVQRDLARRKVELPLGARVILTLEAKTQSLAEKGFRAGLAAKGLDPATPARFVTMKLDGRVAAMMGHWRYSLDQSDGVAGDLRQPASAFKPFIYAAALEKGWKPGSRVLDGPKAGETWSPKLIARSHGRITMSEALTRSANIATVRLLKAAGSERVMDVARRAGITAKLRDDASLALGASEVSLMQLTAAFAPFANGGTAVVPRGYYGVIDAEGTVIHWPQDGRRRALDRKVAEAMKSMLQRVVTQGTGKAAAVIEGAGGKTGTSDGNRDAWFVGFTGGQVTGVWAGAPAGQAKGLPVAGQDMAAVWSRIVLSFRAP